MTRFGSGSDSSKFNIQLSLATLSDRAAQKQKVFLHIVQNFFLKLDRDSKVAITIDLIG